MIVVDTNVISEVMRPQPSPLVLNWLNSQDSNQLSVSTVTLAEIGYGLRILPEGQRRWQLHNLFEQFKLISIVVLSALRSAFLAGLSPSRE